MNFLKGLGLFILMLFPMVVFHELGHYVVGKLLGLEPTAFSFGFGPELLSFNAFNTDWKISLVPMGGYVEFPETARLNRLSWAITCLVGPLFNFIYAYVFMAYINFRYASDLFTLHGTHKEETGEYLVFHPSKFFTGPITVLFRYTKNGKTFHRPIREGAHITSVNNGMKTPFWKKIFFFQFTRADRWLRARAFKNPAVGQFSRTGKILGPIGITQYGAWAFRHSPAFFMSACASFSVSLGFLNLLPLSILDGGQALMALWGVDFQSGPTVGQNVYIILSILITLGLMIFAFGVDIWSVLKSPFKKKENSND